METARNRELRAASLMMELAQQHYDWDLLFSHKGKKGKPGEAFARLSDDKQELLRNLKSDDLHKVRWPAWV